MKFFRQTALALGISLLGCVQAQAVQNQNFNQPSNWKFTAGLGIRNQTPVIAASGVSYKSLTFMLQGGGFHNGPNDFWCGARGSLLWSFFNDLPFSFDAGIGGGYEYAQAPNGMHKALNEATKVKYVRPYNYKENLDISLELWTHLYGAYTQISIPAYRFKKHETQSILWGAGYLFTF